MDFGFSRSHGIVHKLLKGLLLKDGWIYGLKKELFCDFNPGRFKSKKYVVRYITRETI